MPKRKQSYERLTPFLRGAVFAFALAGFTLEDIQDKIKKPDGSTPCLSTIASTIDTAKANGGFRWDGVPSPATGVGKPRVTTPALDRKIHNFVMKNRGSVKCTVALVRKRLPEARRLNKRTLSRRLQESGLKWLRRRRKSIVPAILRPVRCRFARWVLKQADASLRRWAFTDGTAFYLARSGPEKENAVRAALGPFVWRRADGSDALWEDCLGPSSYKKGQGTCVRIWGLLLVGQLFIYVLPAGETMNRWWYQWIVLKQFPKWFAMALGGCRRKPSHLVQDHEKALWTPEALKALDEVGAHLLKRYPKCSQDLNAIETAWREVRARIDDTEPIEFEDRDDFVARVRLAVRWVNANRSQLLLELCSDQKSRAREVLKLEGSRTSF